MRTLAGLLALLLTTAPAAAQTFTSSHLPIVVLDTRGQAIPNEPKIGAHMAVLDNGAGQRNQLSDPPAYAGAIGIETRGSSTQMFPKKSYAVETRGADGESENVSLLGLPKENDWVLYAPYTDKSLVRNVLAYHVARRMGRYATRTRWVEVVLNGDYQGVYVLMEKIKQDKNRVDVAGLDPEDTTGDALTGGYIVKVDKWDGSDNAGWASKHRPLARDDRSVLYQYHDPKPSALTAEQKKYIHEYIDAFEDMMASPGFTDAETGYPKWIETGSFVDFFIVNELSRNVDGFRLSAFLYKDRDSRGGRLVAGPVWDFNLGFGNADYYNGAARDGWQVHFGEAGDDFQVPFWWDRLLQDSVFRAAVAERWRGLRQGPLHTDTLSAFIDAQVALLGDAAGRNFQRWRVLGQYVWPNAYVGPTHASEVDYLKRWIRDRVAWIDRNVDGLRALQREEPGTLPPDLFVLFDLHPNPSTSALTLRATLGQAQVVRLEVFDALGRRVATPFDGFVEAGTGRAFAVDVSALPAGTYFLRATGRSTTLTQAFTIAH